jgi:glycolate oxidase
MRHLVPGRRLSRVKARGVPSELRAAAKAMAGVLGWERVGVLRPETELYASDAGMSARDPGLVVWPDGTEEVAAVVRVCRDQGLPFTARGAGTGLSGGAVGLAGGVVISLARMDAILSVDVDNRCAWVQPGVVNLELSRRLAPHGYHFAPDPSSQAACTIGGNVANNSGGPHTLLHGSTSAHVLAVEVVLPDGEVVTLGSHAPDPPGYDLRGIFVGSEGMCGIATAVCVRLTANAPDRATLMARFATPLDASRATSGIIAAGVIPAALELMDGPMCTAVAAFLGTDDYPSDGSAVLLVEVEGMSAAVAEDVASIQGVLQGNGATAVRRAADDSERDRIWRGRKSAFGAVGRIAPNYYLHDCVVPRTVLPEVLEQVYAIARRHELDVVNVFHAGDGNLHPLLAFDATQPGVMERVKQAGVEIVELCVRVGGVLTGEHGVGLEKQSFMELLFTASDLDAQAKIPRAFDPEAISNPDKVFPRGSRCGDLRELPPDISSAQASGLWV